MREQVAQLTGQRFLADYSSDEQQYKALMDSGVTFAQQHHLRPGIALSAQQMAQLTSDIVWLVEQAVTLPDGTTAKVWVPKVYVRVRDGDLDGAGALLAGKSVNINTAGDITNTGTIAGRKIVSLTADNIQNLGGRISGNTVALAARDDLNNIGGQIDAANALAVAAGRDLNVTSTTRSGASQIGLNSFSRTGLERIAGLYVSNPGGTLLASAGRDVNLTAAILQSQGSVGITAGNNINLATVATAQSANSVRDARNYVRSSQSQEVGSQISAQGPLALSAGNNINAVAASLQSQQSAQLNAANSVTLSAGLATSNFEDAQFAQSRGWLSSASQTSQVTQNSTQAIGTSLGGKTVNLSASKDLSVTGSSVISDSATTLKAGNNVSIEAAGNTSNNTSFLEKKESGVLSGGGLGISYGNREQSTDTKGQSTTAAASTVGSIGGSVNITAGQAYRQVGSDVVAPSGDISIIAKKVDIVEARETTNNQTEQKFSQTGLTLTFTAPVLSALQSAANTVQAIGNTKDSRMQALGAASAALSAKTAIDGLQAAASGMDAGKSLGESANVGVSITLGSNKSQSTTSSQSDSARGSQVQAKNVAIVAAGAGQDSNLLVRGSSISAADSAILAADNQVNFLAAQNTASQVGTNSSQSAGAGVAITYGSNGAAIGFTANASAARGNADGKDTAYTNTQVNAGNLVIVQSAGDTNLKGAVVAARQVQANVGQNLNIQSLQDTSTFDSKNQSIGGSVTVGAGFSGALSIGSSKVSSDFASVGEQSGIKAGDGGFQVAVKNNTDLKGAVIASNQAAVDNNKNSFTAGGRLTSSDIENQARFDGTAFGGTIGVGAELSKSGAGIGNQSGQASSTTSSGISGIAGNTGIRTGDAEKGLKPIFDADQVQKDINAQVVITTAFTRQAIPAAAMFADNKAIELRRQGNEEEARQWDEKGAYRAAIYGGIGLLSGGIGGAIGAVASATIVPTIGEEIAGLNLPEPVRQGLTQLVGLAVGAAAGGAAGAASALPQTAFNYVSHSPFASVRVTVSKENARLQNECGVNCTLADFRRIDLQMQKLDSAGTLASIANISQLTTAQAVTLGENIAALLPLYGTPIALYQAISGQSLTGADLSTTERFFNGVAAAIPAGTVAYKLINSAMADLRLASSVTGVLGADGKALMDFSKLTSQQKGVLGELLGPQTVQTVLPGATRLARTGEIGSQGIDDLYKVTSASADYLVVEYKFGTSALKKTADGLQMSDDWVLGSDRIMKAVLNNSSEAEAVANAVKANRVEKWVVHTVPCWRNIYLDC